MSYQYYPTGEHTAALMWAKFKRRVKRVCDPSAGKAHIFRYAQEGFKGLSEDQIPWLAEIEDEVIEVGRRSTLRLREMARTRFKDLDEKLAIEINAEHHASIKEAGVKVMGYNFLDVQSLATVDGIIMNPPFNDGASHVLHAWKVVYDAEIVAIINAESIRNPYSKERRDLLGLIEKHGTVEFLQDQFVDDVERTTTVEVALIHLEKTPRQYLDTEELFGNLKRGDNKLDEINPEVCTALALPGNFIQDTYVRFVQAVEAARVSSEASAVASHLREGLGITLDEMLAKGVGNDSRGSAEDIRKKANHEFRVQYDDLKKRAWAQIIRSSLLTDRLSNQARKKIEASSSEIYDLEFSPANVHGFLVGVIQSMGDIYRDMICDLFDTIIERSSDNVAFYRTWKSNQKHRVGVRIRKSRFIIPRFEVSAYSGCLGYESQQFLADVDKVFGYLHGVTGPYDGLVNAFMQNEVRGGDRITSRFFEFRFYAGATTIHFYPKSESVVEKINLFVGKLRQWIPGDMEEANADFKKQYEKGEAMTKEYMAQFNKRNRYSYGGDPARQLIWSIKGVQRDTDALERLDEAIGTVHDQMGLHCGPALAGHKAVQKLGSEGDSAAESKESGQLLLLEH